MRPKGVPNNITSTVKNKLDTIIDETMESINIDSLTNAEKIKLVEVCLRYVMPGNANNHIPLPEHIKIKIVR
tara:strand:+ start:101 stop:316 length:216 start_codon:yes stop_codon:yes gene_type:complete